MQKMLFVLVGVLLSLPALATTSSGQRASEIVADIEQIVMRAKQQVRQKGILDQHELKQGEDLLVAGGYPVSVRQPQTDMLVLDVSGVTGDVCDEIKSMGKVGVSFDRRFMLEGDNLPYGVFYNGHYNEVGECHKDGENIVRFATFFRKSAPVSKNPHAMRANFAFGDISDRMPMDDISSAKNCESQECCLRYSGSWQLITEEERFICIPKGWSMAQTHGESRITGKFNHIICTPEEGKATCSSFGECICIPPEASGICGWDTCFVCDQGKGTALCADHGSCTCVPEGSESSCSDTECIACTAERGKPLCPPRGSCICVPDDAEGKCYTQKCVAIPKELAVECWPENGKAICATEFGSKYQEGNSGTIGNFFSAVVLNRDETITIITAHDLWYDDIRVDAGSKIILHNGDSISTRPDYVGTSITYRGIKENKLLFDIHHWTDVVEFDRRERVLISPYISK